MGRWKGTRKIRAWTADDVRRIRLNPVYAGVGSAPALIPESQWAAMFARSCREEGTLSNLRTAWEEMTRAYGQPASMPTREAWIDLWAVRAMEPPGVLAMLTALRTIYGGRPVADA